MAAASGFFATIATNTTDFSERLRKRTSQSTQERTAPSSSDGDEVDKQIEENVLTSIQLAQLAKRMAYKSYAENWQDNFNKTPDVRGPAKIRALLATQGAERGRAHQVATATLHYAGDLTITGLKGKFRSQTSLESVY